MKFKTLKIRNIASIEDAMIDFDAAPLSEADVFLITGKTGAGKSTILDAICLALYGTTPRMKTNQMQGTLEDTQSADGGKEYKVDDVRQMMRRNTGYASVKLTFEGSNGINYLAEWSVQRAHKKPHGALQKKEWCLTNLDTNEAYTKDKEIQSEIAHAVGLDFDQFCRTTMLAQGQFTRFLDSDDKDKAAILENITGATQFMQIGSKIYEIYKHHDTLLNDIDKQLESTTLLSDDQLSELRQVRQALLAEREGVEALLKHDTDKSNWIKWHAEATADLQRAEARRKEAQEAATSPEYKEEERLAADWRATTDVRKLVADILQDTDFIQGAEVGMEKLKADYLSLLAGIRHAEERLQAHLDKGESIQSFLTSQADKVEVYRDLAAVTDLLRRLAECRRSIATLIEKIATESRRQQEVLAPEVKEAKTALKEGEEATTKCRALLTEREEALEKRGLATLRSGHTEAKDTERNLDTAISRLHDLQCAIRDKVEERAAITEMAHALMERRRMLRTVSAKEHDALLVYDTCRGHYEAQKDTVDKLLSRLRTQLHVGDTCPLCRQEIAVAPPMEEEIRAMVATLKNAYDEAERNLNAIREEMRTLRAHLQVESANYADHLKRYRADLTVSNAQATALAAWMKCALEEEDFPAVDIDAIKAGESVAQMQKSIASAQANLVILMTSTKEHITALEGQIEEGEKEEKVVADLRKETDRMQATLLTLQKNFEKANTAMAESQTETSTLSALQKQREQDMVEAENALRSHLSTSTWDGDWMAHPAEFADTLRSMEEKYRKEAEAYANLSDTIRDERTMLEGVKEVKENMLKGIPRWSDIASTQSREVTDLRARFNRLNADVFRSNGLLMSAREIKRERIRQLAIYRRENPGYTRQMYLQLQGYDMQKIQEMEKRLQGVRDEMVKAEQSERDAQSRLATLLSTKPEMEDTDTLESLSERIDTYNARLYEMGTRQGSIDQQLAYDHQNRQKQQTLLKEREEQNAVYQKWDRLNSMLGDAKGDKFRRIALSYVLADLVRSANGYLESLTDRYEMYIAPNSYVIQIKDLYQGGAMRPASTISGGESFLVSLSLALALSDVSAQWKVDTLFIDEGFGTLSGEALQQAVTTLRTLHTRAGRHVGIISHVDELQERIPVQIRVEQHPHSSSSTIDVIG